MTNYPHHNPRTAGPVVEEPKYELSKQTIKTPKELAAWFQNARRHRNISQIDLGDLAEVDLGVISRFERDINIPRLGTILKLLETLGLELIVQPKQLKK